MRDRAVMVITAALLFTALAAPCAFATQAAVPITLAPGEKVLSHSSTISGDSGYALELLKAVQGVRIGADKTTVLVADGEATHPIEIEYGQALNAGLPGTSGSAESGGLSGNTSGGTGGVSLGQVAGLLLGLTVLSRVIGIFRQLTGSRRQP